MAVLFLTKRSIAARGKGFSSRIVASKYFMFAYCSLRNRPQRYRVNQAFLRPTPTVLKEVKCNRRYKFIDFPVAKLLEINC